MQRRRFRKGKKETEAQRLKRIELERKQQNIVQPYFQGTIHTLDSSNRNFPNQSTQNQIKSIRLFSASNSFSKNHQPNNSKDKLAIYKTGNNNYYGIE